MPNFDKNFPRAYEDDEIAEGISVMGKTGRCEQCGRETKFFDQSLGAYVCSDECEEKLWQSEHE